MHCVRQFQHSSEIYFYWISFEVRRLIPDFREQRCLLTLAILWVGTKKSSAFLSKRSGFLALFVLHISLANRATVFLTLFTLAFVAHVRVSYLGGIHSELQRLMLRFEINFWSTLALEMRHSFFNSLFIAYFYIFFTSNY